MISRKNTIKQFIERCTHRFNKSTSQEVRQETRNKKSTIYSNRTKTISNQKGVHYVKQ
jgi:hypothetical protein